MNILDHITPVNLDRLTEQECRDIAHAYHALANYAEQRATVHALRAKGATREATANKAEELCQQRKWDIPKELRWE